MFFILGGLGILPRDSTSCRVHIDNTITITRRVCMHIRISMRFLGCLNTGRTRGQAEESKNGSYPSCAHQQYKYHRSHRSHLLDKAENGRESAKTVFSVTIVFVDVFIVLSKRTIVCDERYPMMQRVLWGVLHHKICDWLGVKGEQLVNFRIGDISTSLPR